MKKLLLLLLLIPNLVMGEGLTILIDENHSINLGKHDCSKSGKNCATTITSFIRMVRTEFAINEACKSVIVIQDNNKPKDWWLWFNFYESLDAQYWTLVEQRQSVGVNVFEGKDNAKDIADKVCKVIKGEGATIK
jgi:hypothetical protein